MKISRILIAIVLLMIPMLGLSVDPIADLETKIAGRQLKLDYESRYGYLRSLLKSLNVPVSSQTLVFSKTSLQSEGISPKTPRAIYFNDDVYVAWVQGSFGIEITSVDSKRGPVFYILGQENDGRPAFEHVGGHVCSVCHFQTSGNKAVLSLTLSSVIPDETGNVEGTFPLTTTEQSPLEQRWGGWYVTGTLGNQKHLGNIILKRPRTPIGDLSGLEFSKSSNVTDLSSRFDTSRYLTPHSDVVALMVLTHQVGVQNLMTIAAAKPEVDPRETGEPLVKALLFANTAALKSPMEGTSGFAAEFSNRGPKDSRGRSLRNFDLKTRLFRYPLSYMIYSKSFDELPEKVKAYVYRRLKEVLTGVDQSATFAHISRPDRTAILEILRDTKTGFPQ